MDGSVFAGAQIPRCFVATNNTNERRSDAAHDRRPPTIENENGMKAAGSVMKAAGKRMKRSCTGGGGRFRNDMIAATALAIRFAIQLPAVLQNMLVATNGTKSATKRTDSKSRRAYPVPGAVHCNAMTHPGALQDTQMLGLAELPVRNPPSITLASGREISKASLFYVLQACGWAALYTVCSIAAESKYGLWPALLDTLIWALCGCLITLAIRHVYRRSRRLHHSYVAIAATALIVSVLLAPLWYLIEHIALRTILPAVLQVDSWRSQFSTYATNELREPLLLTQYLWPFYCIILITWAALYYGVNAILDLESERANVVNALKLADTARLRALQSNLNPHFLFNALNAIATLVREQDFVTAPAMIDALSTFLRSTLERLDTPELRVAEEIELIEQYLRIQRYRFGNRLHAVVEAQQEALGALIPTLILQPLVENAVRYGVLPREAGGSLWVSVRKEPAVLIVSVEDDGPGLNGGTLCAFGMGLQNSSERLIALYGAAASLTIGSRADGTGCAVVIRLPFRLTPVIQPSDYAIEATRA
jgi:two-component system LytT family sensor kinase